MSLFRRKKKEKSKQSETKDVNEEDVISSALDVALSDEVAKVSEITDRTGSHSTTPVSASVDVGESPKTEKVRVISSVSEKTIPSSPSGSMKTKIVQKERQLPGGVILRPEVRKILPNWIEKKYYWARPDPQKHPDLHQSWLEEWSSFLLKWAEATRTHLISVPQLITEFPFNNPVIKAKLLEPEIREICEYLIRKNLAKWHDKSKRRLRIYWKSLEEFAEDLYDWAFMRGESFATLMDLAQADQPWSNLPPRELQRVMELLVKEERAEWADEERRTIQFIYE